MESDVSAGTVAKATGKRERERSMSTGRHLAISFPDAMWYNSNIGLWYHHKLYRQNKQKYILSFLLLCLRSYHYWLLWLAGSHSEVNPTDQNSLQSDYNYWEAKLPYFAQQIANICEMVTFYRNAIPWIGVNGCFFISMVFFLYCFFPQQMNCSKWAKCKNTFLFWRKKNHGEILAHHWFR